jgi:hypothetical protein
MDSDQKFKFRFERTLEAMIENGAFDAEAISLIDKHFAKSDEPYGIEAAREVISQRLMNAFKDTGWAVFDFDGNGLMQVQRDDESGIFESDEDALNFVQTMAKSNSVRHTEALSVHYRDQAAIAALSSKATA